MILVLQSVGDLEPPHAVLQLQEHGVQVLHRYPQVTGKDRYPQVRPGINR